MPEPISAQPLVLNETPERCPDCGGTALASVFRDTGTQVYCTVCRSKRWPNPRNEPRGKALYENMLAAREKVERERHPELDVIRDHLARLNGLDDEERSAAALAMISGTQPDHEIDWKSARFSLVRRADGIPEIQVQARVVVPIENISVTFAIWTDTKPLCKACGLTQGDSMANHRGLVGPNGELPPLSLGGSVREDGVYPHPFEPREEPDA